MPTAGIHAGLGTDESQVDGDKSNKDVVDGVESIFNNRKELGSSHFAKLTIILVRNVQ